MASRETKPPEEPATAVPAQNPTDAFTKSVLRDWGTIEAVFQFAVGTVYTDAFKRLRSAKQLYEKQRSEIMSAAQPQRDVP